MTGRDTPNSVEFRAFLDEPIGSALTSVFQEYWPAYKHWMRHAKQAKAVAPRAQLEEHLPELLPVFEQLVAAVGGSDPSAVAHFLTLYNPPRVVRACSQIVVDSPDGPVLLRSYDHHPAFIDALILKSRWVGPEVIAMADCLWGALDGINEHGLTVSLAFGGRNEIGPGFAAPLIARYLLETCATVEEAKAVLQRVPVYMPYTFLLVDAGGHFVTAYTGPDQETQFVERRSSTNHQAAMDWPKYQLFTQSAERLELLEAMPDRNESIAGYLQDFLSPPLWRTDYMQASGTVYVAEYRPLERSLCLHWLERQEHFSLSDFTPRSFEVPLDYQAKD